MKTYFNFDVKRNIHTWFFIPSFAISKEKFFNSTEIGINIVFLCFIFYAGIERINDDNK